MTRRRASAPTGRAGSCRSAYCPAHPPREISSSQSSPGHRHPRCLVESGQWGFGRDSCCTAATPHSDWHLTGSCARTCRRSLPSCRSFRHACATVSCGICCCRAGVTYGTACRVGYHAAWQTAAADEVLLLIHTVVAALQGVASLSPVQRRVLRVTLCLLHAVRCMAHVATCNTHVARALLRQ